MDLSWEPAGYAHGLENIYLVTSTAGGEFRLTRWRRPNSALPHETLLVATEAARNAIVIDGPDQGRDIAARFEAGESIPGIAAWQH